MVVIYDNLKLLTKEELEEVQDTAENLDFDWCVDDIEVNITSHVPAKGETISPRFDAVASNEGGYFGWHIL